MTDRMLVLNSNLATVKIQLLVGISHTWSAQELQLACNCHFCRTLSPGSCRPRLLCSELLLEGVLSSREPSDRRWLLTSGGLAGWLLPRGLSPFPGKCLHSRRLAI